MKAEFIKMLRGVLKSKTLNTNTLLTGAIVIVATHYGFGDVVTPEEAAVVTALAMGGVNYVLRFFTDKSIPEKGIEVNNPLSGIDVAELYDRLAEEAKARRGK